MARKKPAPAGEPDNEKLLDDIKRTVEAEAEPEKKAEPEIVKEMRDWTEQWKIRSLLAAPFDPGNVVVKSRGDKKYLVLHPSAVADRLDSVFGPGGWTMISKDGECTIVALVGGEKVVRSVRLVAVEADNHVAMAAAASLLGIGRYLDRLPDYHELPAKLPEWAVPKASDNAPVYGKWAAGEKAGPAPVAAAAKKDAPKPEPKPEPEKPKESPSTIFATPKDTAKYWEGMLQNVASPELLSKLCVENLPAMPRDHKTEVWGRITAYGRQRGWQWDNETKEWFDPDAGEETPEGIPW